MMPETGLLHEMITHRAPPAMGGNATYPQPPGQRLPPDPPPPPAPPPARCSCKGRRTRAEDVSGFQGLAVWFPESSTVRRSRVSSRLRSYVSHRRKSRSQEIGARNLHPAQSGLTKVPAFRGLMTKGGCCT